MADQDVAAVAAVGSDLDVVVGVVVAKSMWLTMASCVLLLFPKIACYGQVDLAIQRFGAESGHYSHRKMGKSIDPSAVALAAE